ncbi:MAG: hypothetical protein EAZ97_04990 [Bacteroidetes bacterium]|nr:MAG: hypothetical protein EAZ97_04990 [Bacteroidota bacterium]
MNIKDIESDIKAQFKKRCREMLFLESLLESIANETAKEIYRKSLVVMLYSHFEGFFKQILDDYYVDLINEEKIPLYQASYAIQVSSLLTVFKDLQDITNKSALFKNDLPDDKDLHLFSRRLEFTEKFDEIFGVNTNGKIIKIPVANQNKRKKGEDHIKGLVDTESNLKLSVIRKILFQLGLPYDEFKIYDSSINQLLHNRNEIGHGTFTKGIEKGLYKSLRLSSYKICLGIKNLVLSALKNQEYLKKEFRTIQK